MGKGQSLAEYAFVIAIVIGAVAVFQRPMGDAVLRKTFAKVLELCDRKCVENANGDEEQCNCVDGSSNPKRRKQDTQSWSSGTERIDLSAGAKVDRNWDVSSYTKTAAPPD